MKQGLILAGLFLSLSLTLHAQTFSSGSTGVDGTLDLTSGDRELQLPASGIFNFTTVSIPAGRTLTFKRNLRNTPVIMLAQGSVTIAGTIDVSAGSSPDQPPSGRTPGPGGFYGGAGGQNGFGPGGGQSPPNNDGKWVGPLSLVPIVGGSGGAGYNVGAGGAGGGGGGAIVIASSTSIVQSGNIVANGKISSSTGTGSGGAIRLVANSLNISGSLNAHDCCGVSPGVIRLEAPSGSLNFTGSSIPAAVLSPVNPAIVLSALPALTIASIGGHPVPSYAGSRFDTVDLLLPNQLTDPITVVVQGNNIPLGTQVDVRAVNGSPQATFTPGTLSGTFANSTATPTASGLNRTGVTYLLASATFDPPQGVAMFNPQGTDHVAKVRVEAAPRAKPNYVFLRTNGTIIESKKLPTAFLQQFGQ